MGAVRRVCCSCFKDLKHIKCRSGQVSSAESMFSNLSSQKSSIEHSSDSEFWHHYRYSVCRWLIPAGSSKTEACMPTDPQGKAGAAHGHSPPFYECSINAEPIHDTLVLGSPKESSHPGHNSLTSLQYIMPLIHHS